MSDTNVNVTEPVVSVEPTLVKRPRGRPVGVKDSKPRKRRGKKNS